MYAGLTELDEVFCQCAYLSGDVSLNGRFHTLSRFANRKFKRNHHLFPV